MKFYIRLIIRPGVFLYYEHNVDNKIHFTTDKDLATSFDTRDQAIERIQFLYDKTNWKYNFEITTY